MKHIKSFNESIFSFNSNEFDKPAKSLLKRVKEIFDINSLEIENTGYLYKLEETDSNLGFIEIKVHRCGSDYYLYVDGDSIDCSNGISRDFYNFFKNMESNREKMKKKELAMKFKNKYNL